MAIRPRPATGWWGLLSVERWALRCAGALRWQPCPDGPDSGTSEPSSAVAPHAERSRFAGGSTPLGQTT
eukprot:4618827-Alexandrium_andersonii.AAC.1